MVPNHAKKWMQTNLPALGRQPIGQLCLPGSHDAGIWYLDNHTLPGGTKSNVLTQSKSIFDQLELGVRWFDIRPFLTRDKPEPDGPGTWACGHFINLKGRLGGLHWQGGCSATIDEVVDQINRFTDDNPELIILKVTHVTHLLMRSGVVMKVGREQELQRHHRLELLDKFARLNRVYRAADPLSVVLDELPLEHFIGAGNAAVILLFQDGFATDDLHERGFLRKPQYNVTKKSVTIKQNDSAAVMSTLNPFSIFGPRWNSSSILSLTQAYQDREFPFVLQSITQAPYTSLLVIDDIKDDQLLTMSLAISYLRLNLSRAPAKQMNTVVVWGGKLVDAPDVHARIKKSVARRFPVTNDNLGGDPWPDMRRKSCAIFYFDGGFVKGRFGREGSDIRFERDILSIVYRGADVMDQEVYGRFYRMLVSRDSLRRICKRYRVRYREISSDPEKVEEWPVRDVGKAFEVKSWRRVVRWSRWW